MNLLLHSNYYFLYKKGNKSIEKGTFKVQKPARKAFRVLHLALLLSFLYAAMGGANAQTIHYVMAGATGTGTTSWANASGDLQAMINASVSGDQVWVAGGTYKPNRQADNLTVITSDDRANAFVLKKDVKVYGGFAGTENSLATRNLSLTANASILSGNLGDPGTNTDNTYHVVISAGDAGTAELNSFTIQDGNANADETLYITVNGNSFHAVFGGGIYNSSSSPKLTNVNINGNFALYDGGGMYNTSSNPVLTTVTIIGNTATANGGGIYNYFSSPILTEMTFSGNTTTDYGGAIYNSSSSPILTDITFSENKAYLGGGIFNDDVSLPIIVNSLFTNNTANSGEAIFNQQGNVQLINSTLVGTGNHTVFQEDNGSSWKNSIIWGAIEGAGYSAAYSLIQGNTNTANGNLDASGITAADIFINATNGNYRLKAGSLAINKGNNTYFNVSQTPDLHLITTDLDGTSRIRKGVIDLGAYESSYGGLVSLIPNNGIIYVTESGNGNFTGNSWANASDDIQLGINTSNANQVWVAGGTYKPIYRADNMSGDNPNDRDNAFVLKKDVKVYGGFAGTENSLSDRNLSLTANASILSGDLGLSVVNTDNAYHVVISAGDAGTAELNGFTIKDANANDQDLSILIPVNGNQISRAVGGGIYNESSSPVFTNITISGNAAYYGGGGIFNDLSNAVFTNMTIIGNSAVNNGGGIFNSSSSTILTNITFSGNYAFNGGGVYNNSSSPILTNMTFTQNSANYGGGIANENSSSPTVVNSLFTNNTAPYGEAIFNDGSGQGQFINCTLVGTGQHPVFHENGNSFLKNSIVWGAIYGTGYSAAYSLIQGNTNTANHNIDATGFMATDIFVDTNNGNYRIKAGSPAINTGNNIYFTTGQTPDLHLITTDLDANLRIQKGVIDLGAYESTYGNPVALIPNNGIVYVTETGNGDFTGNSWANASNDIQLGINTTNVQQVWVAGGIYKPNRRADNLSVISQNDRVNAFVLRKDVKVYGGFAGTENVLTDRNLLLTDNASILSGNLGDPGINTDNAYHVVISAGDAGTSELNGFVIQDGYADGAAPINVNGKDIDPANGGGINNISSSPILTNMTISGNTASYAGGGIYNQSSNPIVTDMTISGNTAANAGGGIYNDHSSPVLTHVTISENSGSGIFNAYSSPILTNTTINGNSAFRGGGIHNYLSSPILTNVIISGNSATYYGGGIYNDYHSSPIMVNSLFNNNTATSGEAVYNSSGSGQLINCTLIGTGNNSVFYENGTSFLKNSIVWGAIDGTGYSAAYSLIQGNTNTSTGNLNATGITAADIFIDAANGNYRLKAGSPAIDKGNNAYFDAGANPDLSGIQTDLDNQPRIMNIIDLGAYESVAYTLPVAGSIGGGTSVCSGTNSTTLTLSGYTGTIQWQSSTDSITFNDISDETGATYVASGLTATTWYRAVVKSASTSATTTSVVCKVISEIDASASSNPVALGSAAILSATISPAISGVAVSFSVDPGTGVITIYTAVTNNSGVATTAPISGLSVNLYKVIATAASGCTTSDAAYVAVYDPNSSFISGGGWIISPEGALVAQPLLSGKANFGFVAKYKKGKSQVDGDTEFQFQDGDFNFKSSALDAGSLVISGPKGTYRGEGTVNGAGDYGFMVSAIDGQISGGGGTDMFRIKIWDRSNGNKVVYDNNMGKDENGVPSTTLGGGSIVIHYANNKNTRIMNTGTNVEIANSHSNELTGAGKLTVTVMPNPTSYYFTLVLKSLSKEKIKVTVTDITGRVIEQRTDIPANSTVQLGDNYHPDVYIATFLQGNDKVTIRLIKEGK